MIQKSDGRSQLTRSIPAQANIAGPAEYDLGRLVPFFRAQHSSIVIDVRLGHVERLSGFLRRVALITLQRSKVLRSRLVLVATNPRPLVLWLIYRLMDVVFLICTLCVFVSPFIAVHVGI